MTKRTEIRLLSLNIALSLLAIFCVLEGGLKPGYYTGVMWLATSAIIMIDFVRYQEMLPRIILVVVSLITLVFAVSNFLT